MGFLILLSCVRFEEIRPTAPVKEISIQAAPLELVRGTSFSPGENRFFDNAVASYIGVSYGALQVEFHSAQRLTALLDTPLTRACLTFELKMSIWNAGSGVRMGFLENGPGTPFTGITIMKTDDARVVLTLMAGDKKIQASEYRLSDYSGQWATYFLFIHDGILEFREGTPGTATYAKGTSLPLTSEGVFRQILIERLTTPVEFNLDNVFLYR